MSHNSHRNSAGRSSSRPSASSHQNMTSCSQVDVESANQLISTLRVTELQTFLSENGSSKSGRKFELQQRARELVNNLTPNMYASLQRLFAARHAGMSYNSNQPYEAVPIASRSKGQSSRSSLSSGYARNQQSQANQPLNLSESTPSASYSSMFSLNDINNYFSHPSALNGQPYVKDQFVGPSNPKYAASTVSANVWSVPSTAVTDMSPMADVTFAPLPFYENVATLVNPTNLLPTSQVSGGRPSLQEFTVPFTLNVDHANLISSSRKIIPNTDAFCGTIQQPRVEFENMILMRFGLSNTANSDKVIDDVFPPSLCLKVNSKPATLPPTLPVNKLTHPKDAFKPARPVDLTPLIKITPTSPNTVFINWSQPSLSYNPNCVDLSKRFVFAVFFVKKVSPDELAVKVKSKGIKSSEFTKSIIMDKLQDEDLEIATTFLRASLQCPLGKMRLRSPGRSLNCTHIQCFDLQFFIQMNEKKPTWLCPVCDKKIPFDSLVIDGLFTEILASEVASGTNEIQFIKNNNTVEWSPVVKKEKKSQVEKDGEDSSPEKRKSDNETTNGEKKRKKPDVEIITIDSSDDDESEDDEEDGENDDCNDEETNRRSFSNAAHQVEMLNVSDDDSPVNANPSMPDSFSLFQSAVMAGLEETVNASPFSISSCSSSSSVPIRTQVANTCNTFSTTGYNSRSTMESSNGSAGSTTAAPFHSNYSIESLSASSRRYSSQMPPPYPFEDDDDDIAIIE